MTLLDQGPFAPLDVAGITFSPIVDLPQTYHVHDFSRGDGQETSRTHDYSVGKYDEKRPNMYLGEHFTREERNIHMGIDIGAPAGTVIRTFYEGEIFKMGLNDGPLDYGPTIITKHIWLGQTIYALHGHLTRTSLLQWREGQCFGRGECLGFVGKQDENGGWHPHLHFQLSLAKPETHDLPGVVSASARDRALGVFPDPRLVLGNLY